MAISQGVAPFFPQPGDNPPPNTGVWWNVMQIVKIEQTGVEACTVTMVDGSTWTTVTMSAQEIFNAIKSYILQ